MILCMIDTLIESTKIYFIVCESVEVFEFLKRALMLGSIIRNCNFEFTGYYLGTLVSIETGFSYAPV